MSDTFRFTGPLTDFWWTCEIDFLDLWDPLELFVEVVLIPYVENSSYSHRVTGDPQL